ncbi:hypothetical protein N2152v2_010528 [Parachlorella kessleri]
MQEQALVERLLRIQAEGLHSLKQEWFRDAYNFLKSIEGHWWCQYGDVTAGLAEVLKYHDQQPLVQQIWHEMAAQLSVCTDCVNTYHSAKDYYAANFNQDTVGALLAVLRRLDAQRVASALQQTAGSPPGAELPPEAITSLFEALTYCQLAEDAEVATLLGRALVTLSARYDLALAECGARYPGMYRLLAHPDAQVRSLIAVWRALHTLLPLGRPVLLPVLEQLPSLAGALLGALGTSQHAQQDGEELDGGAEHAAVQWYAAGCAAELCRGAGQKLWDHAGLLPSWVIENLVRQLERDSRGDARLQRGLVEALREVLASLPPGDQDCVVLPRRRALHFLLHHVPASPERYPPLTVLLASQAAFWAVGRALAQGDLSVLDDAHFFLPPLCSMLGEAAALGALLGASQETAADTACEACLACVVGTAGLHEAVVREVAGAAAAKASSWKCLPALWQALATAQVAAPAQLLLSVAASLPPRSVAGQGATRFQQQQQQHGATGLLGGDPSEPSPNAVAASASPAFLVEALQGSAAELLARLGQQANQAWLARHRPQQQQQQQGEGGGSTSVGHSWAADVEAWPEPLLRALGALLLSANLVLRAATEEFLLAATHQLSLPAAMTSIIALNPLAVQHFPSTRQQARQQLEGGQHAKRAIVHAREGFGAAAGNPFARQGASSAAAAVAQAAAALPASQRAEGVLQFQWPSRTLSGNSQQQGQQPDGEQQQQEQRPHQRQQEVVDLTGESPPPSPTAGHRSSLLGGIPPSPPRHSPQRGMPQQAQQLHQSFSGYAKQSQGTFYGRPVAVGSTAVDRAKAAGGRPVSVTAGRAGTRETAAGAVGTARTVGGTSKRAPAAERDTDMESLWPEKWPARRPAPATKASAAAGAGAASVPQGISHEQGTAGRDDAALWPESWPDRAAALPPPGRGRESATGAPGMGETGNSALPPPSATRAEPAAAMKMLPTVAAMPSSSRIPAVPAHQAGGSLRPSSKDGRTGSRPPPNSKLERSTAASFTIPKRSSAGGQAGPTLAAGTKPAPRTSGTAALLEPPPWPAVPAAAVSHGRGASHWSSLVEDDPFADLPARSGPPGQPFRHERTEDAAAAARGAGAPKPTIVRTVIRIAAPPPANRRGPAAVPLWQQRRAALGAAGASAGAQESLPPPLTLDELLQQVLSWHLPAVLSSRPSGARGAQSVPARFASLAEYTSIFRALLLEELRAHLQQSLEENPIPLPLPGVPGLGSGSAFGPAVAGSRAGAARDGSGAGMSGSSGGGERLTLREVQRRSHFYHLEFEASSGSGEGRSRDADGDRQGLRGEDLIVILPLKAQAASGNPTAAGSNAADKAPYCLAVVDRAERRKDGDNSRERRRLLHCRVHVAGGPSAAQLPLHLTPNTSWAAARLMSLTPHLRQLQALVAMQALPSRLRQELLQPRAPSAHAAAAAAAQPPPAAALAALPSGLRDALQGRYNASQQAAVAAALAGFCPSVAPEAPPGGPSGAGKAAASASAAPAPVAAVSSGRPCFTLVQGPPGTGKTAAIIGMLSGLLVANIVSKAGAGRRGASSKGKGKDGREGGKALGSCDVVNPTVRVLVCAQSNAAVDELVTRIATKGLVGRDGSSRQASLVRLGNMEAVSSEAAVYHVSAVAAQLEARDGRIGEASGEASQLSGRLQAIRADLGALQRDIDSLDTAVLASRQRKQAQAPGAQQAGRDVLRERDAKEHRDGERGVSRKRPRGSEAGEGFQDRQRRDGSSDGHCHKRDSESPTRRHGAGRRGGSSDRDRQSRDSESPTRHQGEGRRGGSSDRDRQSRDSESPTRHQGEGRRGGSSDRDRQSRDSRSPTRRRGEGRKGGSDVGGKRQRQHSRERGAGAGRGERREGSEGPSESGGSRRSGSGSDMDLGEGLVTGSEAGEESEEDDVPPSSQEIRKELGPLLQRKQALKRQAAGIASALRASTAAVDARRREMRAAAVAQAEVVACTLSAAGGDLAALMPPGVGFDALICDEAAQALEPSTLIPLQLLAPGARVILVGDPRQLPATVVSRAAAAASLAQSLFERLQTAGYPVCLLSEQYRMHPAIAAWPSAFFYDGRLTDAPGVAPGPAGAGGRAAPWHAMPCFPPLAFFDCLEGRETSATSGGSLSNLEEAELAYTLYSGLASGHGGELGQVAVLTPYQAQLGVLRRTFRQRGGSRAADAVEFATVDGYQGREADVVVFSCVRARGSGSSVGFLADVRRMNVALTRARRSLWVIGHSGTLEGSPPWRDLLKHCQAQGRLFRAGRPYAALLEARSRAELVA